MRYTNLDNTHFTYTVKNLAGNIWYRIAQCRLFGGYLSMSIVRDWGAFSPNSFNIEIPIPYNNGANNINVVKPKPILHNLYNRFGSGFTYIAKIRIVMAAGRYTFIEYMTEETVDRQNGFHFYNHNNISIFKKFEIIEQLSDIDEVICEWNIKQLWEEQTSSTDNMMIKETISELGGGQLTENQ